jgi:predicted MFS family arabinose efflux permease
LLAESRLGQAGRKLDLGGALLITTAVALAVFAVAQLGLPGRMSPWVLPAAVAAVAATAAFFAVERRHPDPLVRADLMRLPSLRKAGTMNILLGLWNAGEMIVLSIYLQQVLHDSPLVTGLVIAPQGVVGFIAGIFGARLAGRFGIRRILMFTGAVAAAGFAVLTQLPAHGHYSLLFTAVMLVGFGTAGTAFGTLVTASTGVADGDQGLVGGVVNTSRQIGAAIGAALLPAVAEAVNSSGQIAGPAGDRAAMLAGAGAAGLATLIALRAPQHVRQPQTATT